MIHLRIKTRIRLLKRFLTESIWRVTENEVSRVQYIFYNILKVMLLSLQRFNEDRIVNKAAALTYNTLLSIVPILAILFAVARGLGFSDIMEGQIRKGLEGQTIAVDTIIQLTDSYLAHAQSGIFIGIGLLVLLWAVLTLTGNMERTFNQIWQVKKQRSPFRKITDYFSIFLLLPIVLVVSGGLSIFMTTALKDVEGYLILSSFAKFLVRTIPYIFIGFMFTGLYIFMPNTRVRFRNAIVPGFIAGAAFQVLQFFYINSQIWVSNYNAIYGSFAAIPMFLLWTQISWSICLFGAELSYCNQNFENYNFAHETRNISRRYHDFLCILIMSFICKRFARGERPYTASSLSQTHNIPIRMTRQIIYELVDLRLIYECNPDADEKGASPFYLPVEDTENLNVGTLLTRLDAAGNENFKIDKDNKYSAAWEALEKARDEYYKDMSHVRLKDLA